MFSGILLHYFNTVIPHTSIAKQIVFNIPTKEVFEKVIYSLFPDSNYTFLQHHRLTAIPFIWISLILILLCFTLIGIPWKLFLKENILRYSIYLFLGGVIIALLYALNGVIIHEWYKPLFAVPIIFGIYSISFPKQPLTRVTAIILTILPLSTIVVYSLSAFSDIRFLPSVATRARVNRYLEVGNLLSEVFPGKNLLTSEIGSLGYSYNGKIIDGVGLISPSALKYQPMSVPDQRSNPYIGAIPSEFVKVTNPELVVSYPIFVEEFDSSNYKNRYEKIVIPALSNRFKFLLDEWNNWGKDSLFIYIRKDILQSNDIEYLKEKLSE